ncbi:PREDICTED: leucoanthocyanidin dioxygenase [Tarenaya hassleriana]|uniref:leucoanthocyanidin dioxygenase n=1 Tax=Tarenaya hassleriana TaxID=28532 RepID=UPI00053C2AEB|nr:PREDICTED: leucoanthocyanidin dioxygenase [Tarenaya hassleriana]
METTSRVEMLAKGGLREIPPQYIQPPELRPKLLKAEDVARIPTVDLSSSFESAREAIGSACHRWGAFYVVNHGVPIQLLNQMRSLGLSFFRDCPVEEKLRYACDSTSAASEGYGRRMLLGSKNNDVLDWRDYFDHHTFPLSRRDPSRWPLNPPSYRQVVTEFSEEMKALAQKLLELISESLGLPSSCIGDAVGEIYQNITVSYYPPCPQPELTLGLQSHSDMGAITLLIQDDVGGLELFKDGHWLTVTPMSDAVLVLLADQTEIITNGTYKSAQHRAITNGNRARLSVATFHDPSKTAKISPTPQLISEGLPARYREIVYGEYVSSWYSDGPEGKRNLDALLLHQS